VLDECHKANGKSSKAGKFVTEMLSMYPKLCVLYSSATAASTSEHLSAMDRFGHWGDGECYPFKTANEFEEALKKG
jgi:hypothetical protein